MSGQEILVSIALGNVNYPVGRLWSHWRKGKESASFQYDESWLTHPERFALEPALKLTQGTFHTQAEQMLFCAIGDSAPDRWGRVLMRRAETQRARSKEEVPRTLGEVDYLLGVNDEARQGALRFSKKPDGPFLSPRDKKAIPPLVHLPKLLSASERFLDEEESVEDLNLLLASGSSLGGARPKASVRDRDGNLSIAKFPSKQDEYNVILWEAVALTLAKNAGIEVPRWWLENIMGKSVLLLRRFDRGKKIRIPFLSAMSLLGAKDNEEHSYLEIVYAIAQNGGRPDADIAELWRRIVFSILISNTDDHLRNHGFLYERQLGWRLSPVYDLNPTPVEMKPRILTTTINFDDHTASLDVALSVVDEFRLSEDEAYAIIRDVAKAVSEWKEVAKSFRLSEREIDRMSSAFEHQDLNKAKRI